MGTDDVDALTGLLTTAAFEQELRRLWDPAVARPVALVALDLVGFKRVNGAVGHAEGDTILAVCADRIRATLGGVASRTGDAFFVALDGVGRDDAVRLARTCITEIVRTPVLEADPPVRYKPMGRDDYWPVIYRRDDDPPDTYVADVGVGPWDGRPLPLPTWGDAHEPALDEHGRARIRGLLVPATAGVAIGSAPTDRWEDLLRLADRAVCEVRWRGGAAEVGIAAPGAGDR